MYLENFVWRAYLLGGYVKVGVGSLGVLFMFCRVEEFSQASGMERELQVNQGTFCRVYETSTTSRHLWPRLLLLYAPIL